MEKRSFGRLGEEWKEANSDLHVAEVATQKDSWVSCIVFGLSFVLLKVRIPEHVRKHDHAKCQHQETNLFFVMGVSLGLKKDLRLIHGTDTFSIVNIKTWSFMCLSMFETLTSTQYINIIKQRPYPPCQGNVSSRNSCCWKPKRNYKRRKWLHVFASLHSRDWRWVECRWCEMGCGSVLDRFL